MLILPLLVFTSFGFATGTQENAAYPQETIKLIVPTKAGGATDIGARILAQYLGKELGQTIVVVNQDGGGGLIGMTTVQNTAADGYTLLYHHTQLSAGYHTKKYDVSYKDYLPISTAVSVNESIVVDAKSPWNSLDDLVKDAKANPGKYYFGVQMGSISHLLAGALMYVGNIDLKIVDAGGEADKLAAMQGGYLHIIMASVAGGKQYQEAGKMKVLAVVSEKRDVTAPDFPTAREQGYDILMPAMHTLYAPKALPESIALILNNAMKNLVGNEEFNSALNKAGQIYEYRSFADTQAFIEKEDAFIGVVADKLGF